MGTEQNNDAKAGEITSGDAGATRRDAIKKAAGAAAVAGTVWAAPRVEGLSLVPSYASAATNLFLIDNSTDGTLSPAPVQIAPGEWYRFRTFTTSGTFSVQAVGSALAGGDFIEALIVGGGGGGSLGGGGGGEIIQRTGVNRITLPSNATGAYAVTVGAGGGGVVSSQFWLGGSSYAAPGVLANSVGGDGGTSSLVRVGTGAFSYSAVGGGGGGSLPLVASGILDTQYAVGRAGASGGGAGYNNTEPTKTVAPAGNLSGGSAVSGNVGGQTRRDQLQFLNTVITRAGGGGGATAPGIQGFDRQANANGSNGGNGLATSFTGTSATYGGGGGGSNLKLTATSYTQPQGGSGGGGKGAYAFSSGGTFDGTAGAPNTGGGGGGGRTTGGTTSMSILNGRDGGSGIVIIRYRCAPPSL